MMKIHEDLLEELTSIVRAESRARAIEDLAQRAGFETILIFVKDANLDFYQPALGFPQTLLHGARWLAFIKECVASQTVYCLNTLPHPASSEEREVLGVAAPDASCVFLGIAASGVASIKPEPELWERLSKLLPIVGIIFSQELDAQSTLDYARFIEQNNLQMHNLTKSLNDVQRLLQKALDEAQQANCAKDEALSLLKMYLETIPVGLAMLDTSLRVREFNKTLSLYTQLPAQQQIGRTLKEVLPRLADKLEPILRKVLFTGMAVTGMEVDNLDNKYPYIKTQGFWLCNFHPVRASRDPQASIIGISLVVVDITSTKLLERERAKSEKLEAIGVLAGGIAHDFNNILTAILGNISLAQFYTETLETPYADELREVLNDSETASLRAKDLTWQLLTFSRGGLPIKKTANVSEFIHESLQLLLRGTAVHCNFEFPEGLWAIEVDLGQLNQVINNLVLNALQAMDYRGDLTVRGSNLMVERHNLDSLTPGRYLKLVIQDSGKGMEPAMLERIFEPYFTTKQQGSGLGLAVCYSIIKNHDGHIEVKSEQGKGTTFNIYLPASTKIVLPEISTALIKPLHMARVLIIDDDSTILQSTQRLLSKVGYEVETARNAEEAIFCFNRALKLERPFHVVITDLTIPGSLPGEEIARQLRELSPGLRILVSSGYSNNAVLARYQDFGFNGVITKPYTRTELVQALENTLAP